MGQVVFFFSFSFLLFFFCGSHLENTLTLRGVRGAGSTHRPTPSASVTMQGQNKLSETQSLKFRKAAQLLLSLFLIVIF